MTRTKKTALCKIPFLYWTGILGFFTVFMRDRDSLQRHTPRILKQYLPYVRSQLWRDCASSIYSTDDIMSGEAFWDASLHQVRICERMGAHVMMRPQGVFISVPPFGGERDHQITVQLNRHFEIARPSVIGQPTRVSFGFHGMGLDSALITAL